MISSGAEPAAHLILRVHQSGRDPRGVDAAAGVLVDPDVRLPAATLQISGSVKQVQDLFVVQLPSNRGDSGIISPLAKMQVESDDN